MLNYVWSFYMQFAAGPNLNMSKCKLLIKDSLPQLKNFPIQPHSNVSIQIIGRNVYEILPDIQEVSSSSD